MVSSTATPASTSKPPIVDSDNAPTPTYWNPDWDNNQPSVYVKFYLIYVLWSIFVELYTLSFAKSELFINDP